MIRRYLTFGVLLAAIWAGAEEDLAAQMNVALNSPNPLVRLGAAESLVEAGRASEARVTSTLVSLLDHDRAPTRCDAALAVLRCENQSESTSVRAVEILLRDGDLPARTEVFKMIEALGPIVRAAQPALMELLKSSECLDRYRAALALSSVAFDNSDAAYAVSSLVADAHPAVQVNASVALSRFEMLDHRVAPAVTSLLNGTNRFLGLNACGIIGRLGPEASEAVPSLQRLLDDRSPGPGKDRGGGAAGVA
ncbi:MAG: hypothetical protein FJ403_19710 [Verrucomicrobia bacterium]|nr:hypothetical protein [Verrucomicrobiota bacterium]